MTATDVRDWDPGDGRLPTPSTTRSPAWSADVTPPTTAALPPLAPDRDPAAPDWSEVVEHFREGLVVCDADGVVRHVSPVAERLLPEVTPGELLSAAGVPGLSDGDAGGFTHHGRRLTARQVPLSGARCCWYVEDVTDSVSRADALLAERARSAFLAVVGDKLGNPLHPDRAAAAVVRLAVPTLAEVAVLVLAPRGRSRPLVAGLALRRRGADGGQRRAGRRGPADRHRRRADRGRAARGRLAGRAGGRRRLAARARRHRERRPGRPAARPRRARRRAAGGPPRHPLVRRGRRRSWLARSRPVPARR